MESDTGARAYEMDSSSRMTKTTTPSICLAYSEWENEGQADSMHRKETDSAQQRPVPDFPLKTLPTAVGISQGWNTDYSFPGSSRNVAKIKSSILD